LRSASKKSLLEENRIRPEGKVMIGGSQITRCFETIPPKLCKFALSIIVGLFVSAGPTVLAQSNNAEMNGNYAFTFSGMTTGGGDAFTPFSAVGRFTADGAGNLTAGELDTNGVGIPEKLVAQPFNGTYQIGADHRGVMDLNIPGGGTLAFVMLANGNAKFVEIDASGGHGTVGSGFLERSDATAYNTSSIVGDYAFGVAGMDTGNDRTAIAGRFTANGAGMFGNGAADANHGGMFTTLNALVATYAVTDATTGRGIINLPPLLGGALQNLNLVFYVVNRAKIFAMETDVVTPMTPLLVGSVVQQQIPLGGFSNASLNGAMVFYLNGRAASGCNGNAGPSPNIFVGTLAGNGLGILNMTYDQNCGGAPSSVVALSGTYAVAGSGRVDIRPGSSYVAAYLVNSNEGYLIVPDSTVLAGFGEPQTAMPLANTAVRGNYGGSATNPQALGVTIFSGEFSADGASPTGTIIGTQDIGAPSGATTGMSVSATYAVSSAPTNGRGTISGGIGGNGVIWTISPSKFIVLSLNDLNPAVLVFEQ